jgi:hypothetical protein
LLEQQEDNRVKPDLVSASRRDDRGSLHGRTLCSWK